jgi:hypothetical protein
MNRAWPLFIIATLPILGWMQLSRSQEPAGGAQPFTPAVPQASMVTGYGGWGYNTGASTAAGSAMNGMASVISARGDAALSGSAAAVNLTQAEKQQIQNRSAATNTYFDMRATNRAAREAERGPSLSMEQMAKIAHDAVPKPLNNQQINPVTGELNWPGPLQVDAFAKDRSEIEKLMANQAYYGSLSYADQMKVKGTVNAMFRVMKDHIKEIPQNDYIAARMFLNSLLYASTKSQLG